MPNKPIIQEITLWGGAEETLHRTIERCIKLMISVVPLDAQFTLLSQKSLHCNPVPIATIHSTKSALHFTDATRGCTGDVLCCTKQRPHSCGDLNPLKKFMDDNDDDDLKAEDLFSIGTFRRRLEPKNFIIALSERKISLKNNDCVSLPQLTLMVEIRFYQKDDETAPCFVLVIRAESNIHGLTVTLPT